MDSDRIYFRAASQSDYDEEYIWTAAFIVKPIVESHEKIYGPNSLREPDVTFKEDKDPHAWRGK